MHGSTQGKNRFTGKLMVLNRYWCEIAYLSLYYVKRRHFERFDSVCGGGFWRGVDRDVTEQNHHCTHTALFSNGSLKAATTTNYPLSLSVFIHFSVDDIQRYKIPDLLPRVAVFFSCYHHSSTTCFYFLTFI